VGVVGLDGNRLSARRALIKMATMLRIRTAAPCFLALFNELTAQQTHMRICGFSGLALPAACCTEMPFWWRRKMPFWFSNFYDQPGIVVDQGPWSALNLVHRKRVLWPRQKVSIKFSSEVFDVQLVAKAMEWFELWPGLSN